MPYIDCLSILSEAKLHAVIHLTCEYRVYYSELDKKKEPQKNGKC